MITGVASSAFHTVTVCHWRVPANDPRVELGRKTGKCGRVLSISKDPVVRTCRCKADLFFCKSNSTAPMLHCLALKPRRWRLAGDDHETDFQANSISPVFSCARFGPSREANIFILFPARDRKIDIGPMFPYHARPCASCLPAAPEVNSRQKSRHPA